MGHCRGYSGIEGYIRTLHWLCDKAVHRGCVGAYSSIEEVHRDCILVM